MAKGEMVSICGFWAQTSGKGVKYMSGTIKQKYLDTLTELGEGKLLLFKNEKRGDKDPDYRLHWAPLKEKQDNNKEQSKQEDMAF